MPAVQHCTGCGHTRGNRDRAARLHLIRVASPYRIGENAAGITNEFSCFTTTPGGLRAGHCPLAAAAARKESRSRTSW
jgi:hypothetical protein